MPYFIQGNTNNRRTQEQQLEYPDFSPWLLLCDLGQGLNFTGLHFSPFLRMVIDFHINSEECCEN